MKLGEKILNARKKRGMKQENLAAALGVSPAAISKIENDSLVNGVDPQTLVKISETLVAPDILIHHCEQCPVRQHIMLKLFPDLNNIRRDPAIIISRLRKEMVEAADAAERLAERFSDTNFRARPDYQATFEKEMEQIVDVKRGIEILEFELLLSGAHTKSELEKVYRQQQKKCVENGHHILPKTGTEG